MKRIYQNIIMLFLSIVLLSSCLKDETIIGPDSPGSTGAIIEFANPDYIVSGSLTATVKAPRYAVTVTRGTASQLHLRINAAGTGKAVTSDVTVGLAVDAAALDAHNTQSGRIIPASAPAPAVTNMFVLPPAGSYTLPASVVIPKGAEGVDFVVPINTTTFLTTTPHKSLYALPLKITTTTSGVISGNFSTIIVNVLAP